MQGPNGDCGKFEKASRKEKAAPMKFAFQLNDRTDVLDQSGYKEEVERRQSKEKEKAAKRQVDIEMRSVEISVRGTKRVKLLSPPLPNQETI